MRVSESLKWECLTCKPKEGPDLLPTCHLSKNPIDLQPHLSKTALTFRPLHIARNIGQKENQSMCSFCYFPDISGYTEVLYHPKTIPLHIEILVG